VISYVIFLISTQHFTTQEINGKVYVDFFLQKNNMLPVDIF